MGRKMLIGVIGIVALTVASVWAEPLMNPGKWEITTKTEMAGMPPQSFTHTQCITREDLVPMNRDTSQECKVTDVVYDGNTVSWKISCDGQGGEMNGSGLVTYTGDDMSGTMSMTMASQGFQMTNTFSGHRIGPCDGSDSGAAMNASDPTPQKDLFGSAEEDPGVDDAADAEKTIEDESEQNFVDEVGSGVRSVFDKFFK
ncbi:MAG: DUF3617 domain-containing protein [Desulfobacterales bacterium]